MLSKDADDLEEEGGEKLTPLGHRQLYDLGAWLRQTYAGQIGLDEYDPALHRLESSDFDRTISSANALSAGLFPIGSRTDLHGGVDGLLPADVAPSIPVYSRRSDNDVYIRAFSICPTFHDRLQDLYESTWWKELENNDQVQGLLQKLAVIFDGDIESVDGAVPLKSIWNAYDQIHVALTECTADTANGNFGDDSAAVMLTGPDSFACQSLPNPSLVTAVTSAEFSQLEDLMEETENRKFGVETAGHLVGSNILWRMLDRAANSSGRFFLYSAHVPTILGLLSTLQADFEADVNERFIEYGSALILEVHEERATTGTSDGSALPQKYIKLKYKSALQDNTVDITLKQSSGDSNVSPSPCGHGGLNSNIDTAGSLESPSFCSLQQFIDWAQMSTLNSLEAWCDACGNDTSDVCMDAILKNLHVVDGEPSYGSSLTSEVMDAAVTDPAVIAATFFGGFLSSLLCVAIGYCFCCCRRRKAQKSVEKLGRDMPHKDNPDDEKQEVETAHFNSDDPATVELHGNEQELL
jgi:hypothetical protein